MTFSSLDSFIGCNFEGLLDALAIFSNKNEENIEVKQNTILLSTVISPEKRFQEFLTGIQSHESRICRGYSWPLESQFNPKNGIRRIPVSLAWQLLIAAEDRKVEWKSSDNHKVSLSDIIAEHTIDLLAGRKEDSQVILSIPNNLHEFSQDALITSLRKKRCSPTLLWRPIAAAIDWCSKLDQKEINRMEKDDPFYFIHFGSDMFEFVPLHIRKVEKNGRAYAVPIRKQPSITPILLSGTLLLASAAEHIAKIKYNTNDESVIWQIFTSLSQLWSLKEELVNPAAYSGFIQEKRFIYNGKSWHVLEDKDDKIDLSLNNIKTLNYPEWFIKSIKECCDIELNLESYKDVFSNIAEWVENQIIELVSNTNDDEPGGAIISGHFKNFKPNGLETFQDIAVRVLEEKINFGFQDNLAAATYIYSDSNSNADHIAEGCFKYACKKSKKLPTYYDSLPKLDIRVRNEDRTGYRWETIVSTDEIEGGDTYHLESFSEKFKKYFSVLQGTQHIDFFLKRMDSDQCRKLPFDFPTPVPEKILVDLKIKMKPAQGFASVEIIPDKPELFGIKHLFLDWQRMEPADCIEEPPPPPPSKIGYPEPVLLKSHLQVFISNQANFKEYLSVSVSPDNTTRYRQVIDNLKQALKTKLFINEKFYGILDSNGDITEPIESNINNSSYSLFNDSYLNAKDLVRKTITKLDSEIKSAIGKQADLYLHLKTLIDIGSFFFIEAPPNCRKYLKSILIKNRTAITVNIIYCIGRCFHLPDEVSLFFEVAVERIKQDPYRTNIWVWAINKILMHREQAYKYLTEEQAIFLVSFARDKMKDELGRHNIHRIFKNSANLFLYLLRWRKNESYFLTKTTEEYPLGQEIKGILTEAVEYAGDNNVKMILEEIAKYIEYQGGIVIDGFDVEKIS